MVEVGDSDLGNCPHEFNKGCVMARADIQRRTNIDAPIPYRKQKHDLSGRQEGKWTGCSLDFQYKIMEVDYMVLRSRGGSGHADNLQLLCPSCNRIKGDRDMAYLLARLGEGGNS